MSKKLGLLTAVALIGLSSAALAAQPDYGAWQSAPPGYTNWPSLPVAAQPVTAVQETTAQVPNFVSDPYGYGALDNARGA